MNAELGRYLDWLKSHGVGFAVAEDLWHGGDHDAPLVEGEGATHAIELPGLPPFVEHRDPAAGVASDHATLDLARALLRGGHITPGCRFWDVGCGTGVLAVAAGLAGARTVVATDVDPEAIELARRTAAEAGVNVHFCRGSLLKPIPPQASADLVAANLPHKPVVAPFHLPVTQNGGREGDVVHRAFAAQASRRLAPGAKVFFFLHSLPHPRLLRHYDGAFDLTLLAWKRRFLGVDEYGDLQGHFRARARAGTSCVLEDGDRSFLVAGIWQAERR
ncbi:MAG: 50S ribosomal protein L11 methyltransferase [Planctomycetota bacterium]